MPRRKQKDTSLSKQVPRRQVGIGSKETVTAPRRVSGEGVGGLIDGGSNPTAAVVVVAACPLHVAAPAELISAFET